MPMNALNDRARWEYELDRRLAIIADWLRSGAWPVGETTRETAAADVWTAIRSMQSLRRDAFNAGAKAMREAAADWLEADGTLRPAGITIIRTLPLPEPTP